MATEASKRIINDITITANPDTQLMQQFANPLIEHSLDLQEKSIPDYNILKYYFNTHKSLNNLTDGNFEFLINSPHPWLLNSLYFDIRIKITKGFVKNKVSPTCNLFNNLFSAIKIYVGQNTQAIDHIDQYNSEWGYIWKFMELSETYRKHMGPLDLFVPDTAGQHNNVTDHTKNKGLASRWNICTAHLAAEPKEDEYLVLRGKIQPSHLLFQKEKMWPPYVPLRFQLCKAELPAAALKFASAKDAEGVAIEILDLQVRYKSFEINQQGYEKFDKMFIRAMETPKELDFPINPYRNPLATYYYLDVRASLNIIPKFVSSYTFPIKWGGPLPKGMIFVLAPYAPSELTHNHLYFDLSFLKSYQININSQTRVPCRVCVEDTSAPFQEVYERYRNFIGAGFTAHCCGIPYNDYVNGAGVICELFNPQDSLNVHSKLEVGSIDLVIEFKKPTTSTYRLISFLIFDQFLVIDEKGNGNLVISV